MPYTAPRTKSAFGSLRGRTRRRAAAHAAGDAEDACTGRLDAAVKPRAVQFVPAVGPAVRSGPVLDAGWLTAPGIVWEPGIGMVVHGSAIPGTNHTFLDKFRFDTGLEAEILPRTQSISSVEDSKSLATVSASPRLHAFVQKHHAATTRVQRPPLRVPHLGIACSGVRIEPPSRHFYVHCDLTYHLIFVLQSLWNNTHSS
ncbi:hypothetical protein DFH09DRAFT_1369855 [Mycena vulgaris]|nr:hypothetical protein DFH09DRAFT_1369855 [Mycena vulgaris]